MLTPKQQKVLEAITDFIWKHWESPTLEELQKILGIRNKRSIVQFLEYLDQKWFINRWRGYRSIRLWDRIVGSQLAIPIPILWVANAGKPLAYAEEKDCWFIHISKNLIKWDTKKYFCVKVEGNSMNRFCLNEKYIQDNSTVLVDTWEKWQSGSNDAYLCIVNGFATIKKIKREWDYLYLLPESDDPKNLPIILTEDDSVEINGKVINVFNIWL
jgi:repressor LexA